MTVTSLELMRNVVLAADEKKAQDIVVIKLSDTTDVCDYFVISTVTSKPQADAVIEAIKEKVKANCQETPLSIEGRGGASWTLIDYGAVVAHVFFPEARDYFRLEQLWGDAPRVDMCHTDKDRTDSEVSSSSS